MKLHRFLITAALVVAAVVTGGTAHAEVVYDAVTPATYTAPSELKAINVATINFDVASGQKIYVYGVLSFADASKRTLVDASVSCAVGSSVGGSVVHNENIGSGAQASATIVARMLATAPYAGPMYCRLYAWVATLSGSSSTVRVTGGHLKIGDRSVPGGVQGASENFVATTSQAVWTPSIPGNTSAGSVTGLWQPPAGTTNLNVFGDLSMTKCRTGDAYGCPSSSPTADSTVRTTLFVTQFNSDGSVCRPSTTYTATAVISDERRHDVTYTNTPTVPVVTGGLCVPKFSIYLKTQVATGGAVVTHGRATAGEMGVLFVIPS